ncbi:MAG: coenzyme F420-0:L-glutamate ligase [Candidatus Eremiobacteraeota bacterium]|nr:coenzyme F420-0:L-glutamate ligase [Candidatus Eremiobacteraeota bacterium]MBC5826246.1 coenzyme F420-0:L-glutamate ligase [Candidatus Eremiobacteraeota bacterium]
MTVDRSFEIRTPTFPFKIVALPVRTPLIRGGSDLPPLIAGCVRGIAGPGDVVCVSETAVAISQGRAIPAEAIRPSRLARVLAERAGPYATVNQPESMQLVIDNAGAWRVLGATLLAAAGRLAGRRGDFYRLLGPAVAEIDGYTGTLPPFERHIVLGPHDPEEFASRIASACAVHAAIVDANDLQKVEILGASPGVRREAVRACLKENPHGNADQQTPVVILKYRPVEGSPSVSPLLEAER